VSVARSVAAVRRRPWLLRLLNALGLDQAAFPSISLRRHQDDDAAPAAATVSSSVGRSSTSSGSSSSSSSSTSSSSSSSSSDGGGGVASSATSYVLWGLTLGVVCDLLAPAGLAPLLPRGAPPFTFPRAPGVLDAAARALYDATRGGGSARIGAGVAAVVAVGVAAAATGGATGLLTWPFARLV
jgi:cobalamin biosynthesis Mg chelatase CobN